MEHQFFSTVTLCAIQLALTMLLIKENCCLIIIE